MFKKAINNKVRFGLTPNRIQESGDNRKFTETEIKNLKNLKFWIKIGKFAPMKLRIVGSLIRITN